jgi:flagellar hook-associated protein 2
MSGTSSIGGVISGLDTNSILDKLSQISQAPVKRLQAQQDTLRAKSAAWSQLEARLLLLRASAAPLASGSAFRAQNVALSRPELAAATASSDAVSGSYTFSVERLAQSHQIASQGFADTTETEIGSGTISLKVGDVYPTVITVDGFTLSELRDAINAADAGVSAAIVNDGSSTPYRLVLTSKTSGMTGGMQVEASLGGGTAPVFADLQTAQNAEIRLGSGPGAITVTSSSNRVEGAIPGVTIDLLNSSPGAPVSVSLSRDTSGIQKQVSDFVVSYNAIVDFFAAQFSYSPDTNESGTLFADYRLESLQSELSFAITGQITGVGVGAQLRSLADIGLRTLSDGKLSLDTTALTAALNANPDGVARVFARVGTTTNPAVMYVSSTTDTMASGAAGWEVEITQAATRARVTAGGAQAGALDANETLTVRGTAIELTAGMTQADVIAAINAHQRETGVAARATDANGLGTGNYLTLTQVSYGSAHHLDAVSTRSNGSGSSSGMGNLSVSDQNAVGEGGLGTGAAGTDVQGTIGGEAATGSGQRLTGISGAPKGLALLVTGDAPGSYGTVTFTVGGAENAFRAAFAATSGDTGTIRSAQTEIGDLITNLDGGIVQAQATADQETERMKTAFARMEAALGQYQTQSQYLTGQIQQMRNASGGA